MTAPSDPTLENLLTRYGPREVGLTLDVAVLALEKHASRLCEIGASEPNAAAILRTIAGRMSHTAGEVHALTGDDSGQAEGGVPQRAHD